MEPAWEPPPLLGLAAALRSLPSLPGTPGPQRHRHVFVLDDFSEGQTLTNLVETLSDLVIQTGHVVALAFAQGRLTTRGRLPSVVVMNMAQDLEFKSVAGNLYHLRQITSLCLSFSSVFED